MDDDVKSHYGSTIRDPMMDQYEVNPDDRDDAKEEPPEIHDDGDEEEEMNYYDWPFTQGGSKEDPSDEFEGGQQFKNKKEVLLTVKQYIIKRVAEYKIVKSDQLRYNAQCIQFRLGCNWCILISYRRKQEKWEVRRYTGYHTCMQTSMGQDHGRLDSKVIAQHIFTMVKADPTINIRVLQGGVNNHFGYKMYLPSKIYFKFGFSLLKKSDVYNKPTKYVSLGTWVQLVTQPWPGSTDTVMFHRVFWTFPPCIKAFKHYKPLISIDGTYLYGKYSGTLLMAIAQDGNANILPIIFAIVEGETKEAWSFFLSYLREHVTPQPEVLVISDRHKSIDVYSKSQREFAHYFGRLKGENVAITNWIEEMSRSQWTQYADEGHRFGHMKTNISECINVVMNNSRNLPITALVKSSYFPNIKMNTSLRLLSLLTGPYL
ncbi:uncharacterized protein LOC130934963 [Arachis stenosperma]|uniref:uncharacterized protein LOC130934963 n=1 Tax=Arachis stenosperma TaxID=217475 RepID=UPI0025AD8E3C|nr:uncharacterized protein LOC130934963 [Arachis stenosperma]